jgi:predicted methyltransferase
MEFIVYKISLIAFMLIVSSGIASAQTLSDIIAARSDEVRQRDVYRHPQQTIEFFQLAPEMSVAEALPGSGWYTKIIAPYIGAKGSVHGINYNDDMWARFGFFSESNIAERIASTAQFPKQVADIIFPPPSAQGFTFAKPPVSLTGTVDRILFIRALHNLNRFESEAGTMSQAITTAHTLLKDDGMVGIVQHRAPEDAPAAWADGSNGYLKQSAVITLFEQGGFKLKATSEINANPKDKPTSDDFVWRLPPSYNGANGDPDKIKEANAIGESDRMTLLFVKR